MIQRAGQRHQAEEEQEEHAEKQDVSPAPDAERLVKERQPLRLEK